jgi:hypothetical protein
VAINNVMDGMNSYPYSDEFYIPMVLPPVVVFVDSDIVHLCFFNFESYSFRFLATFDGVAV